MVDIADEPHRRSFQADADQFHAIVGLDHHLGKMRLRRDAIDRDDLIAQAVAHSFGDGPDLLHRWVRAAEVNVPLELPEGRQAFRGRIDRAADQRIGGIAGEGKSPQRHDHVLQLHDGPTGC